MKKSKKNVKKESREESKKTEDGATLGIVVVSNSEQEKSVGHLQVPPPTQSEEISLDEFLDLNHKSVAENIKNHPVPEADRVVVVGIMIDDSGSMVDLRHALIDGINLSIEAFRGAKGSDFYLDVRGFKKTYFKNFLRDLTDGSFGDYKPDYESTPLVATAISHFKSLRESEKKFQTMGIATTLAMLIITDGFPQDDPDEPVDFANIIRYDDYIVGIGCAEKGEDIPKYKAIFKEMGIKNIFTPTSTSAEIRHAINQFSQSVATLG